MTTLAVVILTYNEGLHIGRAIESVRAISDEIFVIDSGSTDDTIAIATLYGARIFTHPFVTQAQQFQWALDTITITSDWIMRLDADEIIGADLAEVIRRRLPGLPVEITGVNLKRKHIFMGRWIRHGGRYPVTLLRIWRRGAARIEQRWMDEHMILEHGQSIEFEGDFLDHNLNDLTFFTDKHNKYASREAVQILLRRFDLGYIDQKADSKLTSRSAALKRIIKYRVFDKMPFWLGSGGYFLYRYFFRLGFMDGVEGVIYHFLQGFWYRFLIGSKVAEWNREIEAQTDPTERVLTLERLSGYSLTSLKASNQN